MSRSGELYADVIVPLASDWFTFRVGEHIAEEIKVGKSVAVQLGKSKYYLGIVYRLHHDRPHFKTIKSIDSFVDAGPRVAEVHLRFWKWIADYYMCSLGEVMRAAIPSSLKPSGYTLAEFSRDVRKLPTETVFRLHPTVCNPEILNEKFETLKRAPKQYKALAEFLGSICPDNLETEFSESILKECYVRRGDLRADTQILNALVRKDILTSEKREIENHISQREGFDLPELSPAQQKALEEIKRLHQEDKTVLLHGVTGSGKTEIYMHFIAESLDRGRNVIYLLPEIGMSSQLIERLRERFGERLACYHSGFTEKQRTESYRSASMGTESKLYVGARSSVFLPIANPTLIIVDEEHDPAYKQSETAPRYNARDAALVLAKLNNSKVILASATPSIESFANAMDGKYGYVELSQRYSDHSLPRIIVSDTGRAASRGERTVHFNKILLDKISDNLQAKRQIILLQNRRGYSPFVECSTCGHVERCRDCNVAMSYHSADNTMKCHYCGKTRRLPASCPACNQATIETKGFGTQKVEAELQRIFPEVAIERMDRDSTGTYKAFTGITSRFASGQTDILIGTQMVTKGFDFPGVDLVGILNADNLLNFPEFRAGERAYQTIVQASGRAGRKSRIGEVIIQTSNTENEIIRFAASGDYASFARSQLNERKAFNYPPYYRLINITLRHRDEERLYDIALRFGESLKQIFGGRVIGPQPPAIDKIRKEHYLCFMLKVERTSSYEKAKQILKTKIEEAKGQNKSGRLVIFADVDPY